MAMRNGMRTVTDLVDRIEGTGGVVDDVSISRLDGDELDVDVSVRLPAGAAEPPTADDRGESDAEQSAQRTPEETADPPDGSDETNPPGLADTSELSPNFGALSADVGGSVAGAIAGALDDADRQGTDDAGGKQPGPASPQSRERDDEKPETESASSSDDELVACRVEGCEETFETEHGMKIHATKAHQSDDGSGPSPHRDPERLREVYEACDTFEAMTDALGVDVTPQTVRRSMMRLDVHDPTADDEGSTDGTPANDSDDAVSSELVDSESVDAPSVESDDAGTDGTDDAGAVETDDVGAVETDDPDPVESDGNSPEDPNDQEYPDGAADPDPDADGAPAVDVDELLPPAVDGDAFVAAVQEASTLYDVQRRLDMNREETQSLLAEFGLLDLVHGRVATKGERDEQKADIERRIVKRVDGRTGEAPDGRSRDQRDDRTSDPSGEQAQAD